MEPDGLGVRVDPVDEVCETLSDELESDGLDCVDALWVTPEFASTVVSPAEPCIVRSWVWVVVWSELASSLQSACPPEPVSTALAVSPKPSNSG